MAEAEDRLLQHLFDDALAAAARATKCYALQSTAVPDKTKRTGEMRARPTVVEFQDKVPDMRDKALRQKKFEEALKKGKSALNDVEEMSLSFFKRPWAGKRLAFAEESLKDAAECLENCCPPPQLGSAHIRMLLDRRNRRTSTCSSTYNAHSPARSTTENNRISNVNTLRLPEDEGSLPSTGELRRLTGVSDHRPLNEVGNVVNQGGIIASESTHEEQTQDGNVCATINPADVEGLKDLTDDGAELILQVPSAKVIVESVMRSSSPVADAIQRSNSPVTEILRFQTPLNRLHTAASDDSPIHAYIAPEYSGPVQMASLSGEDSPVSLVRPNALDLHVMLDLLIMCGVKMQMIVPQDVQHAAAEIQTKQASRHFQSQAWPLQGHQEKLRSGGLDTETDLLPEMYSRFHALSWRLEAQAELDQAMGRIQKLCAQKRFYEKGKDAFEDASEEFDEGAYPNAKTKAQDADKLFALSTTHDHKLLVQELITRSHKANDMTLRDLAFESLQKATQFTKECKFDEARLAIKEAGAAYQNIEREDHGAEIEKALEYVDNAEEEHFYQKLRTQFLVKQGIIICRQI